MNYFKNAKVNWNTWSPEDIIFKSNNVIKKLMPQENVLSYKSKSDRDAQMCKKTNGKLHTSSWNNGSYHGSENYRAVHVQLKDVKSEFPSANVDFVDCTHRKDSVGNNLGRVNILIYINSFHCEWTWHQGQNGHYTKKRGQNICPLEEGYRICYGGQGDSNSLSYNEFSELLDITESVRRFLFEVLVPHQQGIELVA